MFSATSWFVVLVATALLASLNGCYLKFPCTILYYTCQFNWNSAHLQLFILKWVSLHTNVYFFTLGLYCTNSPSFTEWVATDSLAWCSWAPAHCWHWQSQGSIVWLQHPLHWLDSYANVDTACWTGRLVSWLRAESGPSPRPRSQESSLSCTLDK